LLAGSAAWLVYSDMRIVDEQGRTISETFWRDRRNNHTDLSSLLLSNTITGAASLFRRELLDLALPFPPPVGDPFHDQWLAAVALASGEIAYVDRPLYDYVQHGGAARGHEAAMRTFAPGRHVSWRDPLGPEPRPGDVTATSPLALEGRAERPLTAVTSGAKARSSSTAAGGPREGLFARSDRVDRHPVNVLVDANVLSEATRPEPNPGVLEWLSTHERELVVWPYDAIARLRPPALEPELVIRFGDMPTSKALRQWLASLRGLRQVVVDPAFGWNEHSSRAETIVRAEPRSLAGGLAAILAGDREEWRAAWLDAGRRAAAATEAELEALEEPTEPGAHAACRGSTPTATSSTRPPRCRSATRRRSFRPPPRR
jgi:hypothetical protein